MAMRYQFTKRHMLNVPTPRQRAMYARWRARRRKQQRQKLLGAVRG